MLTLTITTKDGTEKMECLHCSLGHFGEDATTWVAAKMCNGKIYLKRFRDASLKSIRMVQIPTGTAVGAMR